MATCRQSIWRVMKQNFRCFASLREKVGPISSQDLYEPKFEVVRKYPEYDMLNVRLQGYDYVPLENYQSFVHKIAKRFGFTVEDRYF